MNDPTRSVGYTLGSSEAEGCDRLIAEDWYKFQDDANMPTECPPVLRCGSTGPIWINGILMYTLLSTSTCSIQYQYKKEMSYDNETTIHQSQNNKNVSKYRSPCDLQQQ